MCCAPVLRTASCPAKLAGPIAVRSTQFGGGAAHRRCRIVRVLWRKQWVEDFRYVINGARTLQTELSNREGHEALLIRG